MKTITITNQKGGTGKTTTAAAIAACLRARGKSVLLIDLDPQCNLTYACGADPEGKTILEVLRGEISAIQAIRKSDAGDLIAASRGLSGADTFIKDTGKEYRLAEALEPIRGKYSYVIIDTPPALGILTINALTASDSVLIPAQADIFSLQGVEQLAETIRPVIKYCNPKLRIEGIVLTRYSARTILSRDVTELAEQLAAKLGTKVFSARIREAVAVRESQISRTPLPAYAPDANVTHDYEALTDELVG